MYDCQQFCQHCFAVKLAIRTISTLTIGTVCHLRYLCGMKSLMLNKNISRRVEAGHPWIFANEVNRGKALDAAAKKGEIVDGKRFRTALYEELKKYYGSQGFVQYDAEPEPGRKHLYVNW